MRQGVPSLVDRLRLRSLDRSELRLSMSGGYAQSAATTPPGRGTPAGGSCPTSATPRPATAVRGAVLTAASAAQTPRLVDEVLTSAGKELPGGGSCSSSHSSASLAAGVEAALGCAVRGVLSAELGGQPAAANVPPVAPAATAQMGK